MPNFEKWIQDNLGLIEFYSSWYGDSIYVFTIYNFDDFYAKLHSDYPNYDCKQVGTFALVAIMQISITAPKIHYLLLILVS